MLYSKTFQAWKSQHFNSSTVLTLPYLTSGVDRLLHLPSTEAVSAQPNARPRM